MRTAGASTGASARTMKHIRLEVIEMVAKEHGIEPAWLWLYLNGFKHRVPPRARTIIEDELLAEKTQQGEEVNDGTA